jgi:hypothetical protein
LRHVPGALVALDDDRRDAQLAQPRAERDAALAAADDDHVGLRRVAELFGLAPALLEPRAPLGVGAVLDAFRPPVPHVLLVAFELLERGQQRPRLVVVAQAQVAAAAADPRLELQPRLGHALGGRRRLGDTPAARARARERVIEHVLDALPPLHRLDVPGERDEIAPEAVDRKELRRRGRVTLRQGLVEPRQPRVDLGRGGRNGGVGHSVLLADDWT